MASRIWRRCAGLGLVIVRQEPFHRGAAVAGAVEDLQQHRVGHLEARRQGFGRGRDQTVESPLVPIYKSLRRLGFDDLAPLGRVVAGAGYGTFVLADVLGRLGDDVPAVS